MTTELSRQLLPLQQPQLQDRHTSERQSRGCFPASRAPASGVATGQLREEWPRVLRGPGTLGAPASFRLQRVSRTLCPTQHPTFTHNKSNLTVISPCKAPRKLPENQPENQSDQLYPLWAERDSGSLLRTQAPRSDQHLPPVRWDRHKRTPSAPDGQGPGILTWTQMALDEDLFTYKLHSGFQTLHVISRGMQGT